MGPRHFDHVRGPSVGTLKHNDKSSGAEGGNTESMSVQESLKRCFTNMIINLRIV